MKKSQVTDQIKQLHHKASIDFKSNHISGMDCEGNDTDTEDEHGHALSSNGDKRDTVCIKF